MRTQRVVITGMGAVSPFGEGCELLCQNLWQNHCGISALKEREGTTSTKGTESTGEAESERTPMASECAVGGLVPAIQTKRIPRDVRRTMSPMSMYATLAAWEALAHAGLDKNALPPMGIAIGTTLGSPEALHDFFYEYITQNNVDSVRSTTFFKVMGHSVASNLALALGVRGRLLAPAAACASGLVSLGLGYETIAHGLEERMLCGGADEFHMLTVATFDKMQAASHAKEPACASLPFDTRRSGVVVSEGVGLLLLESLESALARQAPILAEISGYASTTSPYSIAHPDSEGMRECMEKALNAASLDAHNIDYVNAHATATTAGDAAEARAIGALFGEHAVPVSSLKGHLGHTLAASGSLESIACVDMLQQQALLPTLHLQQLDSACAQLDHITTIRGKDITHCMKNSFAMGGIYASMVFSRFVLS